jgi:N-acetylmuramoyl-L-alanine amidase
MIAELKTVNMGCIKRNLYIPRFPDCPTILVEPEYLILPAQEKLFLDDDYRQRLARSIVKGIRNFLIEVSSVDRDKISREP